MKKFALIFLSLCFLLQFTACGEIVKNEVSSKELYTIGTDLISVMNEMIQSEDYADIIGANDVEALIETVDTNDYASPVAVYCVSLPDITELFEITGNDDMNQWNNLSGNLQRQIENRVSFSTIVNIINSQQGSQKITFSSLYTAFDKNENIKVDETTIYLYVFEEGTPIVITFSEDGGVSGQFVFLEDIDTLSNVRTALEEYKCTVTEVDIDWAFIIMSSQNSTRVKFTL